MPFAFTQQIPGLDPLYGNELQWFLDAGPERGVVEHLGGLLECYDPSKYIFVDLGVNIGVFSTVASLLDFRTLGFDLQPACLFAASRLVTLNNRTELVSLLHMGVSDTQVVLEIRDTDTTRCSGTFGLGSLGATPTTITSLTIPALTLDLMFWDAETRAATVSIAVMKMDIESSEPAAIAGARNLLEAGAIHNILMEVNGYQKPTKKEAQEMFNKLLSYGYQPVQLYRWLNQVEPQYAAREKWTELFLDTRAGKRKKKSERGGVGLNMTEAPRPWLRADVPHPLEWSGKSQSTSGWVIGNSSGWLDDLWRDHMSVNVWWRKIV